MGWRTMRPNSSSRNLTWVPASIPCLRRSPAGTTSWPLDVNVPLISFTAYILSWVRHIGSEWSHRPTSKECDFVVKIFVNTVGTEAQILRIGISRFFDVTCLYIQLFKINPLKF